MSHSKAMNPFSNTSPIGDGAMAEGIRAAFGADPTRRFWKPRLQRKAEDSSSTPATSDVKQLTAFPELIAGYHDDLLKSCNPTPFAREPLAGDSYFGIKREAIIITLPENGDDRILLAELIIRLLNAMPCDKEVCTAAFIAYMGMTFGPELYNELVECVRRSGAVVRFVNFENMLEEYGVTLSAVADHNKNSLFVDEPNLVQYGMIIGNLVSKKLTVNNLLPWFERRLSSYQVRTHADVLSGGLKEYPILLENAVEVHNMASANVGIRRALVRALTTQKLRDADSPLVAGSTILLSLLEFTELTHILKIQKYIILDAPFVLLFPEVRGELSSLHVAFLDFRKFGEDRALVKVTHKPEDTSTLQRSKMPLISNFAIALAMEKKEAGFTNYKGLDVTPQITVMMERYYQLVTIFTKGEMALARMYYNQEEQKKVQSIVEQGVINEYDITDFIDCLKKDTTTS